MNDIENSLLQTLDSHPEVWSVRMLVVDEMLKRDAGEEAAELICAAPCPPESDKDLYRLVEMGGEKSLPLVEEFVKSNPANAYGHGVLASLFRLVGNEDRAAQHFSVSAALGGTTDRGDAVQQGEQEEKSEPVFATPPLGKPAQAIPLPPEFAPIAQTPKEKPNRQATSKATAIIIAVGVHVLIALIATLVIILPSAKDEPEIIAAVIGPPGKKQEMQKKNIVKQTRKSSASAAAAAPMAQLMRASAVAKIALPNVTRTSTGPLGIGDADFGGGGFGTGGDGLGSGASFFGGHSTGKRFLFIIDHSGSMKPKQVQLRNDELKRALSSLKGVEYQVLLFAGGGYYAWKGWSIKPLRGLSNIATGPKGSYKFISVKRYEDYEFDGPRSKFPREQWLAANSENIKQTMKIVTTHRLFAGTDWGLALEIGHMMKPPPDVIFFMSDGTGGNSPPPILAMNAKHGKPVINTVAMQTTAGLDQFAEIAKKTGGTFTIVDKKGKAIDGFEFKKNPAKFKGRL